MIPHSSRQGEFCVIAFNCFLLRLLLILCALETLPIFTRMV